MTDLVGPRVAGATISTQVFDETLTSGEYPIDVLLSFAFHSKTDHHELKRNLPPGSLMWIDSGAFTAYTSGKTFEVSEYADHLEASRGAWDYAFTLDVIGDHRESMRQTEDLLSRGYPVTPIYTFGTPLKEFRALCRDFGYVGVGGIVPFTASRGKILKYLRTLTHIADEHGTAVHALGVASRRVITQSGVWSGDSSALEQSKAFGAITFYFKAIGKTQAVPLSDIETLYRYRGDLNRHGFPLAEVMRAKRWIPELGEDMLRACYRSVAEGWGDTRARVKVQPPERLPLPDSWSFKQGSATP